MIETNVVQLADARDRFYIEFHPEIAREAQAAAERIRVHGRIAGESIVSIGRELIEQKEAIGHGNFGAWLKAEFDWSERHAENLMAVTEKFGAKSATVAVLGPSRALYALAAPSTPELVRDVVEELAVDGVKLTADDIRRLKAAHAEALERMTETERAAAEAVEADRARNERALADVRKQLADAAGTEAGRRAALEAEKEVLEARVKALEEDPIWEVHRQAIREAAEESEADKRKERREKTEAQSPSYKPNPALEVTLTLIGPVRVLADSVVPRVSPAMILAGFLDESDQRDGMLAARTLRDFLNKLLEASNA